MKGHIRERSPGHYAIILDVRDPSGSANGAGTASRATSGKRRLNAPASSRQ